MGLKVAIVGSREIEDYELVKQAIEASGYEIGLVISGGARGVDSLGEQWAKENKVKIDRKSAEWDNLEAPGAVIKERMNPWSKKKEKYNAHAGFARNSDMVKLADAVIAIQLEDTSGTQDTIKKAKDKGIPVFIYPPRDENEKKTYKRNF
jgi:predicted Rossmann fold nucleotide-binding protein DprA/Smf involved in DNA uptake